MLLRIFKTSQPISWIIIVAFITISRAILFFTFYTPDETVISPNFFSTLLANYALKSPFLSHLFSTLIIIFSGFYFNQIAQNLNLVKGIHYLILMFVGIFMSFQPENLIVTPLLWSVPILLYSYSLILHQSKGDVSLIPVFNSAFFIGLASLLFFPSIMMLPISIIALTYLNKANWRHYVVTLIGFATTWLFHDVIAYSLNNTAVLKWNVWPQLIGGFNPENFQPYWASGILFGLIVMQSFVYLQTSSRSVMRIHKSLTLNYWYLVFTLLGSGFFVTEGNGIISFTIIPISILFSVFHYEVKRWWVGDLTFLLLLAAIYFSYINV